MSLPELHIPNASVTTAHIKASLAFAWYRLPMVDVPFPLGSRPVPGLNYQLLTSHKCNSQPTQQLEVKFKFKVKVKVSFFTTGGLPPISSSWRQAP
jgi:hypothetical protein